MRIKVALPSEGPTLDSRLSEHFGRAPFYILVDIENYEIKRYDVLENPLINSHPPGDIPKMLASKNVNVIICKRMGHRAISYFEELGINVMKSDAESIKEALMRFIEKLKSNYDV